MDDESTHYAKSISMDFVPVLSNPPEPHGFPIPMEILCAGKSSSSNNTSMDTSDSNFSRVSIHREQLNSDAWAALHPEQIDDLVSTIDIDAPSGASSDDDDDDGNNLSTSNPHNPTAHDPPNSAEGRLSSLRAVFHGTRAAAAAAPAAIQGSGTAESTGGGGEYGSDEELVLDDGGAGDDEEDDGGGKMPPAAASDHSSVLSITSNRPVAVEMPPRKKRRGKKSSGSAVPPSPTSRKKPSRPKICDNVLGFVRRSDLAAILPSEYPALNIVPPDAPDRTPMWGYNRGKKITATGNRYWIEFEDFPRSSKDVNRPGLRAKKNQKFQIAVDRRKFHVALPGEKDKPVEHFVEYFEDLERAAGDSNPKVMSTRQFVTKTDEEVLQMTEFVMKQEGGVEVMWDILPEDEIADIGKEFSFPTGPPDLQGIDWDSSPADIFFENFFPSLNGIAATMDEYVWDRRYPNRETIVRENIRFNDPTDADPDWKVKQIVLLIIMATLYREVSTCSSPTCNITYRR